MKQTAVEFLIEEIKPFLSMPIEDAYKTILQAKAMEKEQIKEAAISQGNITGEQYYTETYGK
jgi:hypothetical protein